MTTVLSIVIDTDFFKCKITSLFFFSGRERERERLWKKKQLFTYSLGKKDNARILFNPQSKDLEFLTIARKKAFF